jgi:phospholipid-binding lipoprotein MlaA
MEIIMHLRHCEVADSFYNPRNIKIYIRVYAILVALLSLPAVGAADDKPFKQTFHFRKSNSIPQEDASLRQQYAEYGGIDAQDSYIETNNSQSGPLSVAQNTTGSSVNVDDTSSLFDSEPLSDASDPGAANSGTMTELEKEIWDPIEPVNSAIFSFNDFLDTYILEPVARGYHNVTPDPVETGVVNFFRNLNFPSYFVSSVFRGNFSDAGNHTARFLINSTIGLAGFLDIATRFDLKHKEEDFGTALAYYDIPAGPYIMFPFWGPSNLRDACGRVVDFFLDPFVIVGFTRGTSRDLVIAGTSVNVLRIVSTRARLLEAIQAAKESSLDYYLFSQSSYYQYRNGLVKQLKNDKLEQKNATPKFENGMN